MIYFLKKIGLTVAILFISRISLGGDSVVFEEHFDNAAKSIDERWDYQVGPAGHINCSHSKEAVSCDNSSCKLKVMKNPNSGSEWLCGSILTKQPFLYGYFEATYKIAPASGINNAFWLRSKIDDSGAFCEIDINEGHFPDEVNMNIHTSLPRLKRLPQKMKIADGLDWHVYALDWSEHFIKWYVDGHLVRTIETPEICKRPMYLRLSVAVTEWAGKIKLETEDSFMLVKHLVVKEIVE